MELGTHPNAGAFMRLQPDRRPTTGAMLTALDAALGGRLAVLDHLREVAQESRLIGHQISRLWEEYCFKPNRRAP